MSVEAEKIIQIKSWKPRVLHAQEAARLARNNSIQGRLESAKMYVNEAFDTGKIEFFEKADDVLKRRFDDVSRSKVMKGMRKSVMQEEMRKRYEGEGEKVIDSVSGKRFWMRKRKPHLKLI